MTGPVDPSRSEHETEDRPDGPRPGGSDEPTRPEPTPAVPERPAAAGWTGGPRPGSAPPTVPGSVSQPGSVPRGPSSVPSTPAGGWTIRPAEPRRPGTASAPGAPAPVRPPVPSGVPPRPSPLPPPRTTGSPAPPGAVAGSLGSTTVVPESPRRPAPRPVSRAGVGARGRKAKLAVKRVDPWSVFVTSLVLSLLLGLITLVAAFVLYAILSALGVPRSVNNNVGPIADNPHLLTQGKFIGIAGLIAGVDVVLLTLLATIGAMLYNLVSTFTGGLELTLAERD